MKKKILSAILALTLTVGPCSVALAADQGGATTDKLKSYGAIVYEDEDEEVVINSLDLYMLAEQLDQVRLNVANQLGKLHTFFTTGQGTALTTDGHIGITYTQPSGKDAVDPLTLDLNVLVEGIAASQRISSDVKDYGYSAGTKLYRTADGGLTTDRGTENLPELTIKEAEPDNLSAGTAAWVKGRLILGTGKDNQTYMEKGENASASEGADDMSGVFSSFNSVGGWMGGFNGTIPYTFTPGKSLLIILDGPLSGSIYSENAPDTVCRKRYFTIFYWRNNPHTSIKLKVKEPGGGVNNTLLVKEW